MQITNLTNEQRRQLIDTQQVHEAWREANLDDRRLRGSMRWARRKSGSYLLRKIALSERSLGPKSEQTEAAYQAFVAGKQEMENRRKALGDRLRRLAPINVAMGLGRVPGIAARILRRCDESGLLGQQILVVKTIALFAYEAKAGVILSSDVMTTGDLDFLFDSRRRLSLAVQDVRETALIGLLRQVDKTFKTSRAQSYRAVNGQGYFVELISPQPKDVFRDRSAETLANVPDDLVGVPLIGLDWLVSAPRLTAVAIDENGLPIRLVVIDPRVFALHKVWLSRRRDRDPLKRRRDLDQAIAAARIAVGSLGLSFESNNLAALPLALRNEAPGLLSGREDPSPSPEW